MNTQPPPPPPPSFGSQQMRAEFMLDPKYLALNHGSFGATPSKVFADRIAQMRMIETNPDHLVKVTFDGLLDKALVPVSCLLGLEGDLGSLVFTNNATTGLNAVLRSLKQILRSTGRYPKPTALKAQKILYFSTVYDKLLFAINYTCQNDGFLLFKSTLNIPFPLRTCFRSYDAITSLPAVITPSKNLQSFSESRNPDLLDAAHAIGQIPFDLSEIKPDFCVTIYTSGSTVGTNDISAFLTTHSALAFRAWIGGESAIQTYCHTLLLAAPKSLYASMATIAVPETPFVTPLLMSKVSVFLTREQNCSVYPFKHGGRYWVRVSAQVYLNEGDFEKLAELLYRVFYGELAVE
ncbi:hypothetical protein BCR33DRAFT_724754 [Rhizoclosmatium globosum]|uniref:PLP-dependent transferase n=1 Tax=Rhizoclosmatium globosum TaxID=329046 RepID=A0A1Y2B333_9FUNG|nr:hypothetical protein BCR33DRAFT_724754 [Rhizoclosmatium globosum]|eukprot:ORY29248.1 hypothetical protein BCR33DRAFT_724754 [Rhizoclosmatium globosum]